MSIPKIMMAIWKYSLCLNDKSKMVYHSTHDKTLINHELYEMAIKRNSPNIEHYKAHEMATKKYDYQKEANEYYGNINKNKKNK